MGLRDCFVAACRYCTRNKDTHIQLRETKARQFTRCIELDQVDYLFSYGLKNCRIVPNLGNNCYTVQRCSIVS